MMFAVLTWLAIGLAIRTSVLRDARRAHGARGRPRRSCSLAACAVALAGVLSRSPMDAHRWQRAALRRASRNAALRRNDGGANRRRVPYARNSALRAASRARRLETTCMRACPHLRASQSLRSRMRW